MTINEILNKYTIGELDVNEANAKLKEIGSNVILRPERNKLTAAEIAATHVGDTPEKVSGWGLLDIGIGSFEKVHVVNGVTVDYDNGAETNYALVLIGGMTYQVKGSRLVKLEK